MHYITKAGVKFLNERIQTRQARKAKQIKPKDTSTAHLSTDPNYFGATIEGKPKSKKRKVGVRKLKRFEPKEKMNSAEARATIDKYKRKITAGDKIDRIVTHGKTIIDGHHKYQAHKELGTKNVSTVSPGSVTKG